MKRSAIALGLAGAVAVSASVLAQAQPTWLPPAEKDRCPSKWGAGDERGSGNHQKAAAVMKAAGMIKTGEVIELAHVLNDKMPFFGTRRFDVHVKRTFLNQPANKRGSNEELVVSEIGQVGTQLDGFAHQSHEDSLYNCFKISEISARGGFTKLGIHQLGTVFGRGVLIDVAAYKGVETLPDTYEITVEDLEGALKKQGTTLQAGDAVLINTGWHKLWGKDNARYVKSCPGHRHQGGAVADRQGPAAARLRQLAGGGGAQPRSADLAARASAGPGGQRRAPLENLKLDELAQKQVYEFAFLMQPIKLQGGTGSTVAPVAVR